MTEYEELLYLAELFEVMVRSAYSLPKINLRNDKDVVFTILDPSSSDDPEDFDTAHLSLEDVDEEELDLSDVDTVYAEDLCISVIYDGFINQWVIVYTPRNGYGFEVRAHNLSKGVKRAIQAVESHLAFQQGDASHWMKDMEEELKEL